MGRGREERPRDIHHRNPRSTGGDNRSSNLSDVDRGQHRAWHRLFHNFGPIVIAGIINQTWLHADWRLVAVPAQGFLGLWQLANWYQALSRRKGENQDGDGI